MHPTPPLTSLALLVSEKGSWGWEGPGDWTHCSINYTLSYHWAQCSPTPPGVNSFLTSSESNGASVARLLRQLLFLSAHWVTAAKRSGPVCGDWVGGNGKCEEVGDWRGNFIPSKTPSAARLVQTERLFLARYQWDASAAESVTGWGGRKT